MEGNILVDISRNTIWHGLSFAFARVLYDKNCRIMGILATFPASDAFLM
jgi:hypothetical protein